MNYLKEMDDQLMKAKKMLNNRDMKEPALRMMKELYEQRGHILGEFDTSTLNAK